MKNALAMPLQFTIRVFLIATGVNTAVSMAQILHDNTLKRFDSLWAAAFLLVASAAFFAVISAFIFLLASMHARINRERLFWLIMLAGLIVTVTIFTLFREVFARYEGTPEMFAAISSFAITVSVSSQYQLFLNYPGKTVVLQEEGTSEKNKGHLKARS